MSSPAAKSLFAGYRFSAEVISHAVWLYFRFPLSLRMVEEMLAARGIVVSHETVRRWALKFGQEFANRIRRRLPRAGDKWHLDGHRQVKRAWRAGPGRVGSRNELASRQVSLFWPSLPSRGDQPGGLAVLSLSAQP